MRGGHIRKRLRPDGTVQGYQVRLVDPRRPGKWILKTFDRKLDAERWLLKEQASIQRGDWADPRGADRTFAAVVDEYRTTWADLEPRTKAGYEHILKKHVLPFFGPTKVGAITADMIQRWVNELGEGRARNTVRRVYGVLRSALDVAVSRRYIAANPCASVKLPKKPGTTERMMYLTPDEVRTLAETIDPHWRVAVYVASYCGLRAGELWGLRRRDVDVVRGEIAVRQALKEINGAPDLPPEERGLIFGEPKSAASKRKLSLPAPIKQLLAEHLLLPLGGTDPDGLIFTTASGLPVRHGLFYSRVFKPAVKTALPHKAALRFHDLRHTCASLSLAVAPNLHVVKERLGHEDIRTTINTYGHPLPSVEAALADGLAQMFAAAEAPATNVVALPVNR